MRIGFIGSVDFSRHCLEAVAAAGGEVILVLTNPPDRNRVNADAADLSATAAGLGIPALVVDKINTPEVLVALREARPDILFVFGFSQLISRELLAMAPMGALGVHPSPLPVGRGRHPLIWTLVNDLRQGALSFFWINEGADTGDLLWQQPFPVTDDDDAGTLMDKVKALASLAIPEFLPQLAAGTAPRIPQDPAKATVWHKRGMDDGEIHWVGPGRVAFNLIRALTRPYVGAHSYCDGSMIVVWKARVEASDDPAPPGCVIAFDADGPLIRTADGALRLLQWTSEANGVNLQVGSKLGKPS